MNENVKEMSLVELKNNVQILETLLPKSHGTEWTQRNERLNELKKQLDYRQASEQKPKHQFISSLYREKAEHKIESHPMEAIFLGIAGTY